MDLTDAYNFWVYLFGYGDGMFHYELFGNLFIGLCVTVMAFLPLFVLRKILDLIGG